MVWIPFVALLVIAVFLWWVVVLEGHRFGGRKTLVEVEPIERRLLVASNAIERVA